MEAIKELFFSQSAAESQSQGWLIPTGHPEDCTLGGLWKKQPKCLSPTSLTEPQRTDLSPPSHGPQCNHPWPEGPSMTISWMRDATPPDLRVPFCRVLPPPRSHHRAHKGRPTTLRTNNTCHPACCQCSARRYQRLKGGSQRQTWLSNPGLECSPAERVNSKDLSGML